MKSQILIDCGDSWFEFSKSKTGQLDYLGEIQLKEMPSTSEYNKYSSSPYFTPSWYIFLSKNINYNPVIYVSKDTDISDPDTFSYLTHIGALLLAIKAKDSLLAGELYLRRQCVFDKFALLTQYIMQDSSIKILFSLCFGKMIEVLPSKIPLIYDSAIKKMQLDVSKETLEQGFIRYLKQNELCISLPLVGTQFYNWDSSPDVLDRLTDNLFCENLLERATKIRTLKQEFYENLETSVQAEPYNHVDKNSILACIESIESKISGNPGLEKAGHIRALASKIIRLAKPTKLNYNGKLIRLSYKDIVVQITV